MMDIIIKAQQTAQRLHKDQTRKSGGLPYFTHLHNVAQIVAQYTSDPELIAAAYLHDTIEDTPYTPEELDRDFGERIARVVLSVSKKTLDINEYLGKITNKETALISGADKLDNSQGLLGVTDWAVFNFPPEEKIRQYVLVANKIGKYWPELSDRILEILSFVDKNINNP